MNEFDERLGDWVVPLERPLLTYVNTIRPQLQHELRLGYTHHPEPKVMFRAFKECPYEKVKVVIIGQDPYPNSQATGLCFDNFTQVKNVSPSLSNIYKELRDDVGANPNFNQDSFLQHLPPQGVLLLNTALSVRDGEAASHAKLWREFTLQVIEVLCRKEKLVWILWGRHAQSFMEEINPEHRAISGAHPSPLAGGKFFGGSYFSRCNEHLEEYNLRPIFW